MFEAYFTAIYCTAHALEGKLYHTLFNESPLLIRRSVQQFSVLRRLCVGVPKP